MANETMNQKELKRLLDYDYKTGVFRWKMQKGVRGVIGKVAGYSYNNYRNKYVRIKIDGEFNHAHRLAWLYQYGEWPRGQIDHIDGNGLNNAINNLRVVTQSGNQRNARLRIDNKTGISGVCWNKLENKYKARIRINGKQVHLGTFSNIKEAEMAVAIAKNNNGYSDRHGRSEKT